MGFLTVLRKEKKKENVVRVLVLGLDNAGKSSIVCQITGEDIMKVAPTFGFKIKTAFWKETRLDLWDIGGQKSIRPYWQNCFEQTDAVLWVVDSTDPDRIDISKKELFDLLKQRRLQSIPLLIMANKQDLEFACTPEEIEETLQMEDIKNRTCVLPVSGLTGYGMEIAFNWLLQAIQETRLGVYV